MADESAAPVEQPQVVTGPLPPLQNAGWVNELIGQSWPYINSALAAFAEEDLLDLLRTELGSLGHSIEIVEFHIGSGPLTLGGVHVHDNPHKSPQITMDIDFTYKGQPTFKGTVVGIPFGIDNIEVAGRLRIILTMMGAMPILGGISFFFIHLPTLDFNLTGAANFADIWGIRSAVDSIIYTQLAKYVQFPNRQVVLLDKSGTVDQSLLLHPFPKAVVFITVVEVSNVQDLDTFGGGSDVYLKLSVGTDEFKTTVKDDVQTTTVVFGERFDSILEEYEDVLLSLEGFDLDVTSDDEIGKSVLNLSSIKGTSQVTVPLKSSSQNSSASLVVQQMLLSRSLRVVTPATDPTTGNPLPSFLLVVRVGEVVGLPTVTTYGTPAYGVTVAIGEQKLASDVNLSDTTSEAGTIHQLPDGSRQFRFLLTGANAPASVEVLNKTLSSTAGQYEMSLDSLQTQENMSARDTYALSTSGVTMDIQFQLYGLVPISG